MREEFCQQLQIGTNYDMIEKIFYCGGKKCWLYYMDGFSDVGIQERVLQYLSGITDKQIQAVQSMEQFGEQLVPYGECFVFYKIEDAVKMLFSGPFALFVDGINGVLMVDMRQYPTRGISEPENDRVLRGPRDGFCEVLNFNTGMIRRRIRDTDLRFEIVSCQCLGKSDIVVGYMEGRADKALVEKIKQDIQNIHTDTCMINQESLVEILQPKKMLSPFPKVRSTERPDVAAHSLAEGRVVVLIDNSPSCLIFPTYLPDFCEQASDFYFSPAVGTYLRWIRILTTFITIFVTPFWLWLSHTAMALPDWLTFVRVTDTAALPLVAQLLLLELAIDGLRMASINTPDPMAASVSIVGGLILGDFAVQSGVIVSQAIFYMSFVSIATFTQPSVELGYAIKFCRIGLTILSWLFGIWGIVAGTATLFIILRSMRAYDGKNYLYPFIPFQKQQVQTLLFRRDAKSKK